MRRYLLIGSCAAVLAGGGVAWAQMPPGGPGGPGGDGPHGPMERGGDRMERMHWRHAMPRGTSFRFRKGDAEVDISCSPEEAVQACVNGASTLLDKLGAAGAAAPKPAQ